MSIEGASNLKYCNLLNQLNQSSSSPWRRGRIPVGTQCTHMTCLHSPRSCATILILSICADLVTNHWYHRSTIRSFFLVAHFHLFNTNTNWIVISIAPVKVWKQEWDYLSSWAVTKDNYLPHHFWHALCRKASSILVRLRL